MNYLEINRESWNKRTAVHRNSDFYKQGEFLAGRSSLNEIELSLLGNIRGKSLLHLQCHFGQDSISLARMGAHVTGVDLSDAAIDLANEVSVKTGTPVHFVCCDVYESLDHVKPGFDFVFTSYGTIGWLPDLKRWAQVIYDALKPGGRLIFVEFHPVIWMFDDDFEQVKYRYFNSGPISETEAGTYADPDAPINSDYVTWNHSLTEVINALTDVGLRVDNFQEYDYSPYPCFRDTIEFQPGKFRIAKHGDKLPMVYSIVATKP